MHMAVRFLEAGLLLWLALLAVIIAGRVLSGDIGGGGFLRTHRGEDGVVPERAASMAIAPVVIVGYAFAALHADMNVLHPSLPPLSDNLLMLLTGGNGVYLAGKIARIQ
jgi:hypothetical protein